MIERHKITLRRRLEEGQDGWRNQVETYADPTTERVYGWYTPSSDEPTTGDHRVRTVLKLLAPASLAFASGDLVTTPYAPAGEFRVIGRPEEANAGPFSDWRPGLVVNLSEVTG